MGSTYSTKEFKFKERSIIVTMDWGEHEHFGLELHVDEEITEVHGLCNWSFGYEDWSEEVWKKWGQYIEHQIDLCNGDSSKLKILIDRLQAIECNYLNYELGKEEFGDGTHLRDLNMILQLASMTEFIPFRSSMKRIMTEEEVEYYLWLKGYNLIVDGQVDPALTFEYAIQEGYHPYKSTETGNHIFVQGGPI